MYIFIYPLLTFYMKEDSQDGLRRASGIPQMAVGGDNRSPPGVGLLRLFMIGLYLESLLHVGRSYGHNSFYQSDRSYNVFYDCQEEIYGTWSSQFIIPL